MAYRVVKYVMLNSVGTNIIVTPLSTNSGDVSPAPLPMIYAHAH